MVRLFPQRGRGRAYLAVLAGFAILIVLILVVLHVGELQRFAALAGNAKPAWFLAALALQVATYVAAASVWQRTLAGAGQRLVFRSLVGLSIAKLFTDQVFPSVGLSGTALLARGLARRGVPGTVATEVVLVSLLSFYASNLLGAIVALGVLWRRHEANPALVLAGAVFSAMAILIPAGALSLKRWGKRAPRWLHKFPGAVTLLDTVAHASAAPLRNVRLLGEAFLLQSIVIVLDAATLWAVFCALGQPADLLTAFTGFLMASVVSAIGLVPLGLGTFEASLVATLSVLGVEVEVALAATLLLRGLTFWLPMLPGLWLARRELSERGDAPASAST